MSGVTKFITILFSILIFGSVKILAEPILTENLSSLSERAKALLCQQSYCIKLPVTVVLESYKSYYGYYHINEKKISILPGQSDISTLMTLVHEYTHVYRSQFNPNEETWLSEGLAKLMEYKMSTVWPESYQFNLPKNPALAFENSERRFVPNGPGYSDSFWLVYYLYQRFGSDKLLTKLLQSKLSGWDSVLNAISELQNDKSIAVDSSIINKLAILRHFALALLVNNSFAAKYSLFYIGDQYRSLAQTDFSEPKDIVLKNSSDSKIIFSKISIRKGAKESFVIISIDPLVIEPASPENKNQGLYYISIF